MSGRLLRTVCALALAATLPTAPSAVATPAPDPVPEPVPSWTVEGPGPAAEEAPGSVAEEAPGSAAGMAPEAATQAAPGSVAGMLGRLRTLYQQAEEATEAYNAAEEELKALGTRTDELTGDLTRTREALARGRAEAGRLARAQYQGRTALPAALRLLFARDPDRALTENHVVRRAARERAALVARLAEGEKRAGVLATASRTALDRERTLAARHKQARDGVTARLREVERMLAGLSAEQVDGLAALEAAQTAGAQRALVDAGELDPDSGAAPSALGSRAVAYAAGQIGKPYLWGAEGPGSFDCSGLTSQAWASAGRAIPRTSQEQWRTLPRVPLRSLRPGDLVVYFPKATHVALYLGDGKVIQAPRPGGRVKVSPLAANPLLGAVRPDPADRPLAGYTPPELPAGAAAGSDEGYDAEGGRA
ncbi:C40 family peptidase [Streptomyces lichenis]|uniref:NlpC/P60 family protein n=1 Tax=Streptomyces lichenis TaxID=2306967 RepID=A0ABT0I7Z4_9ACTN|nr:C40 family peptidase [Streptomyces lichenis]MCK8677417.1 NlpC/P60 family protein [Streptomyces lichenis]